MRVVFDTNVLYSAFAAKSFCEEVLDEAVGDWVLVWSRPCSTISNAFSRAGIILARPRKLL